jgi:P pilus assembly chaperone PapD
MRIPFFRIFSLLLITVAGQYSARPQLVINEIMYDPVAVHDSVGEWFELYNPGTIPVDINGWVIECHGDLIHHVDSPGALLVQPGAYVVLAQTANQAVNGNVPVFYAYGDDISLGGGDALWIHDTRGKLVDTVDYAASFPDPAGASLELYNPLMENRLGKNWRAAITAWSGADKGTPGARNSVYSACMPGDIIITEIMHNPNNVPDADGEWFEVYNTTEEFLNMEGWTIQGSDGESFTVSERFMVPPTGFAVFTVNADPGTNGGLMTEPMYDWGTSTTMSLSRSDMIALKCGVLVIDSVAYDYNTGWPDPAGTSMILTTFADDNTLSRNWSMAPMREPGYMGSSGDMGSPGILGSGQSRDDLNPPFIYYARPTSPAQLDVRFSEEVNESTAEAVVNYFIDNDIGTPLGATRDPIDRALVHLTVDTLDIEILYSISVTGVTDIAGNTLLPDTLTFMYTTAVYPGDIVISEIMSNPGAVGDPDGEWFEVYNRTDNDIDMNGWTIRDNGTDMVFVNAPVMVPARGFAVFTVNGDSSTNGHMFVAYDSCGCPCSAMHDWGTNGDFSLANNVDQIILQVDGVTIDSVSYDGSWPKPIGASLHLRYLRFDNAEMANWTESTVREGGYAGDTGDLGSPGTLGTGPTLGYPFTMTATIVDGPNPVPPEGDTLQVRTQNFNPLMAQPWVDFWASQIAPDGSTSIELSPRLVMIRANGFSQRTSRIILGPDDLPGDHLFVFTLGTQGFYPYDTLAVDSLVVTKETGFARSDEGAGLAGDIPAAMALHRNFPNPFNPSTSIRYDLSHDSKVVLKVYSMLGQEIAVLVDDFQTAGYRSAIWDGRNSAGDPVSSGTYLYRMQAGEFTATGRMLFLK